MERCPNCGASIRTGARFCTACGFRLLQPADTASVVPSVDDTPVAVADRSSDASPSLTPKLAPASVDDNYAPDHAETNQFDSSRSPDGEPTSLGTEPDEHPDETAAFGEAGSTISEHTEASLDPMSDREQTSLRAEDATGSVMVNDERSNLESPETTEVAEPPAGSFDDPAAELASAAAFSYPDADAIAESADQASGASPSRLAPTASDNETDTDDNPRNELTDSSTTSPTGSTGSDDRMASNQEEPVAAPWQDDVVVETSFIGEKDYPGFYNVDTGFPSDSDSTGQVADPEMAHSQMAHPHMDGQADPVDDDSLVHPNDIGSHSAADDKEKESETPSGRDEDYEPWGNAGLHDAGSPANRGGEANGLPIDQDVLVPADQQQDSEGITGLARAQMLLEQLRSTIDSLAETPSEPATGPTDQRASFSVDEIGQILDGFPSPAVDADRLAEVTRLAEDLPGRDYDIRALQTFAQERNTILSLAMEVQQLRDVIDQIRSVLGPSES